jgi:hypothetical protein
MDNIWKSIWKDCKAIDDEKKDFLQSLFKFSDRWQDTIDALVSPTDELTPQQQFLTTLILENENARRTNLERVAFRKADIKEFRKTTKTIIQDVMKHDFDELAKEAIDNKTDDLLLNYQNFQFNGHRIPISKRAFSMDIQDDHGQDLKFYFAQANKDEYFLVSGECRLDRHYTSFDLWIAVEGNDARLLNLYMAKLSAVEKETGCSIDAVCVIEKAAGPRGVISLINPLEIALREAENKEKKLFVYSQKSKRMVYPANANEESSENMNVCLFSDVLLTGSGVKRTRDAISEKFHKWTILGAVVLADYRSTDEAMVTTEDKTYPLFNADQADYKKSLERNEKKVDLNRIYSRRELSSMGNYYSIFPSLYLSETEQGHLSKKAEDIAWWEENCKSIIEKYKKRISQGCWIGILEGKEYIKDEIEDFSQIEQRKGKSMSYIQWLETNLY